MNDLPMSEPRNLVDVVHLKKYFPIRGGLMKRPIGAVRAVDDVTFYIKKGETVGLVGESGCGKTTVGRAIMMLTAPTDGFVFWNAPTNVVRDLTNLDEAMTSVKKGRMTQEQAIRIANLVEKLLGTGSTCEISDEKKRHLCAAAEKLRGHIQGMTQKRMPKAQEEDFLDLANEAMEEVAKRYCINFRKKSELKRMRGAIQFVFQDPFSSLDPKMLIKDIVAEPVIAQMKYRRADQMAKKAEENKILTSLNNGELSPQEALILIQRIPRTLRHPGVDEYKYATLSKKKVDVKGKLVEKYFLVKGSGPGGAPAAGRMSKGEEVRNRVIQMLEKVGLNVEHMYRYPHEFSGGQRQRIGIARALSVNPEFVVLDEPTSALDVSVQAQILNQLNQLQNDFGLTFLFISHDLSTIRYMCDRIAVMYLGKLAEYASKADLFARPTHPYTEALLSVIPVPDPDLKRDRIILPGDVPSPANPPPGCRFHTRCPLAIDICRVVEPPLVDIGGEHFVACHVRAPASRYAT